MNVQLGIFDAGVKLRFRSNDESIIVGAIHYKELRKYEKLITLGVWDTKKGLLRSCSVPFKAIRRDIHTKDLFSTLLVHFTEHLIGVIAPFQIAPD